MKANEEFGLKKLNLKSRERDKTGSLKELSAH